MAERALIFRLGSLLDGFRADYATAPEFKTSAMWLCSRVCPVFFRRALISGQLYVVRSRNKPAKNNPLRETAPKRLADQNPVLWILAASWYCLVLLLLEPRWVNFGLKSPSMFVSDLNLLENFKMAVARSGAKNRSISDVISEVHK